MGRAFITRILRGGFMMNINTNTLIQDLLAWGWKKIPRKRTDIVVYQFVKEEVFLQVIIPLDKGLSDYDDAMLDTLNTISSFKQVDLKTIIDTYTISPRV